MILFKALKALLDRVFNFREPRKLSHIAPSLFQKLENRDCAESAWLFRAWKCLLCTSRFLDTMINNRYIELISNALVRPHASAQASPSHVFGGRNQSNFSLLAWEPYRSRPQIVQSATQATTLIRICSETQSRRTFLSLRIRSKNANKDAQRVLIHRSSSGNGTSTFSQAILKKDLAWGDAQICQED